ncbi:nitrate reductase cytochrome c-type subunit [Tenacibaculum maritimum]|uniref:nitrate reductase cytochrome c-type subunit n=1 Tax=Tenacibaculum maritimum TaxID=107401 RepID=UPI0010A2DA2B|nr:nitrate reductase cytochrome c-type subunit [Tenacibaculum maritimum]QCD62249.1 cytochrome C [Tenacibaculum maritimum]
MKKGFGVILLFVLLFIGFIWGWNINHQEKLEATYIPLKKREHFSIIPSESGVFTRSIHALAYAKMPIDEEYQRSLKDYYKNRAYHGAPPSIPHSVDEKQGIGGNVCLKCHENGGFVPKYKAYTPVTPHPELVNCRQCHVTQKGNALFKSGEFAVVNPPKVGTNKALPTSPPIIPHQIQLRENCLACHAGPSAPKEIRVSHPERTNCKQCHIPNTKELIAIKAFTRKTNEYN